MIIKICILMTVILILLRKIWNLTRNCKVLRIFLTDYLHQICWIITSICSMSHESRLANRCKYFLRAYSMIHFFHKHYNLKMMKGFVKIFLKYKRIKIKFSKSILTFLFIKNLSSYLLFQYLMAKVLNKLFQKRSKLMLQQTNAHRSRLFYFKQFFYLCLQTQQLFQKIHLKF